jgi:hypothetical protein
MSHTVTLVDYQLRTILLDISKEVDYDDDNMLGVDFEFFQHDSVAELYLVQLNITINEKTPAGADHALHLRAEVEGYVEVAAGLDNEALRADLVDGAEMVFNTFRGTLGALLGQTGARDYLLPAVDFQEIARQSPLQ